MDMEHNHCGKYVNPNDGYHGDAQNDPMRIYCDKACCDKIEPDEETEL